MAKNNQKITAKCFQGVNLFILLRHPSNNARLYATFIFTTNDLEETCKEMKNDIQYRAFHHKWSKKNSLFLLYFLIHIHVLTVCIAFVN